MALLADGADRCCISAEVVHVGFADTDSSACLRMLIVRHFVLGLAHVLGLELGLVVCS